MKITRRVVWLPANEDGCSLWRMFLPHLRYPGSVYKTQSPGQAMSIGSLKGFQVAVVQRLVSPANLAAMNMLKENGIKIIYDLDDNIWNVPKYNPAYPIFRNKAVLHGAEKCAKAADIITTSTSWLATAVKRRLGDSVKIEVVENAVDFDLFYPARKKSKRSYTVIGWAGTPTHHIDLTYAMNALAKVMRMRSDIRCEFLGSKKLPEQIEECINRGYISADRCRTLPWVSPKEYPAWVSNLGWDLSLAPLAVGNEFNNSKSNIKLLEAAAIGIPCLASPTLEYSKFCEGIPELENLLCNSTEDWVGKINEYVNSPALRDAAAALMRQRAFERYEIHSRIETLNRIFENV